MTMEHETVTLRDFFSHEIESLKRQTELRFDSLDRALNLAREDAKAKYEHLNELRQEVTTDRGILVPKDQCLKTHDDLDKWATTVNEKLTKLETRSITWTASVGLFFLLINLVMRWYGK